MNWKYIFNPLQKYSEKKLLIFSFAIIIFGIVVTYFFGTYDNNLAQGGIADKTLLYITLINFLQQIGKIFILFSLLLILGLAINKKTRSIDIFNVVAISKLPGYVGLIMMRLIMGRPKNFKSQAESEQYLKLSSEHLIQIVSSKLLITAAAVIGIIILWKGFKTATNVKKWYHIVLFISIIILAAIFSYFVVWLSYTFKFKN